MSTFYLDTSAAVKLYVPEAGSNWLRNLLTTDQSPVVLSSHLLRIELRSALARRLREGTVTPEEYRRMLDVFAEDCVTLYRFVPLTEAMIQQAGDLVERYPLRGYDAAHLATLLRSVPLLAQTDRADCLPACVEITNTLYPSKTRLRLGSEFLLHQAGMGMPVYGISIRDDQLAHAAQLHLIGAEAGGQ